MPDQSEWIVADDDEEEQHHVTLPVVAATQSPEGRYQPPTEETWVPFDPENEDEDDDENALNPNSRVSDVEIARAAGDSFLSGDEVSLEQHLL